MTFFKSLFKFTAVLGAGHQRADIQSNQTLAFQGFRHIAGNNAVRQPFNNGGFTYTGLTDQGRVVLGAAA